MPLAINLMKKKSFRGGSIHNMPQIMTTPLDSRQLLAFATLAKSGSFTETAKSLFVTQSAISHSIKSLEGDLGCKLFARIGKKSHLTEAGERFLPYALQILKDMEAARLEMDELSQRGRGRLRIGASTTACQYILPPVLRELKQCFPKCQITIVSADTPNAVDEVCENKTDISITMAPEGIHKCTFHPLFQDELRFITSPIHPWAVASRVKRNEIADENFVLYNKGSYTFRLIENYFNKEELKINRFIELGSMEAIKELVKIGMGVGILAPWIVRNELEAHSLVSLPLGRTKLKRRWGISYQKGRKLNLIEETFVSLCESGIENMILDNVITEIA